MQGLILWLAQGFGVGRIPVMPGTFGSMIGIGWAMLLLLPGNFWIYLGGTILGIFISVWLCGAGEKILNQKDPSSIVIDEIIAIPICFLGLFVRDWFSIGKLPEPENLIVVHWKSVLLVFVLFRIFDISKPWPVRQSQELPGGWGVTIDDVLAGVYVAVVLFLGSFLPFSLPAQG